MSASRRPTSAPALRRAAARFTATVDLPTPPLPDATAIVCLTPGKISEGLGREKAGRTLAVIRTSTPVTPGSSPTASSACDLKRSRTGHAGVVSSKVKLTLPCALTSSSLIMPRLTTSRPRSGSLMRESASRTCCDEGALTVAILPIATSLGEHARLRRARRSRSRRTGSGATDAADVPATRFGAPAKFMTPMKQVTALAPSSDLLAYYASSASDVYFQRAKRTLTGARVDAVVAMDFFASKPGILCGVDEAVRLLGEVLQEGDEAYAIVEGASIGAKATALRV